MTANDLREIEAGYRARLADGDKPVPLRVRLIDCLKLQGRHADALVVIDECIELTPGKMRFHRMRAMTLNHLGRHREAMQSVDAAISFEPESVSLRLLAARTELAQLNPDAAQTRIDQALILDPTEQQLQRMKAIQARIVAMQRQSEQRPVKWLTRKLNRRRRIVAREEGEGG